MPRLTDARVKTLAVAEGRRDVKEYDDQVTGFGVRVTRAGHRSFFLNYSVGGRERRITIGHYPAWGVAAAREQAAKLRRRVDAGDDPQEERLSKRNDKTVEQLWDRYRVEVSARKAQSTHRNETSVWERLVLPAIGRTRLADLRPSDIDKLHHAISSNAPIQANRMVSFLRHAFGKALRWGWMDHNPATGVTRNQEEPRERFLSYEELERLLGALDRRPDTPSSLALRFILFTGCRRGEAFKAQWREFDLQNGYWTKPSAHTKRKRIHRVPLNSAALAVLTRAQRLASGEYVFPGSAGAHLVEVKRLFRAACSEAQISDLRIHDLRHSFASFLASDGQSLHIVGRLLGHTQVSTTMRYAHLFDDPLRAASNIMSKIAQGKSDDDETRSLPSE